MKRLIEQFMIFIILTLFLPNHYLTSIFIGLCLMMFAIEIVMVIKKRNMDVTDKENEQFKFGDFLTISFIAIINLIERVEASNLLFAYSWLIYLVINFIYCLVKKDYKLKKNLIRTEYLFDVYCLFYLVGMIIKIKVII